MAHATRATASPSRCLGRADVSLAGLVEKLGWSLPRVIAIGLALLALGCVAWATMDIFARPPDYPEACVLFNASRLREGYALYVDPIVGAHEYGEPPARYFVAYTPLYASLISLLPAPHATAIGRVAGLLAWLTALALAVVRGRRALRPHATLAALFVASSFLFTRWTAVVKGDGLALLLVGVAFTGTLRRRRAGVLEGVLFALAWLVKPSVAGLAIGTLGADLILRRGRSYGALAAIGALAVALSAFEVLSHGVALAHLRAATGLGFRMDLFRDVALSRLPFVAGLLACALLGAPRARHLRIGQLALGGLVMSTLIGFGALGKPGATVNYLMEPALASVTILGVIPMRIPRRALGLVLGSVVILSLGWSSVATIRSLRSEWHAGADERRALDRIRDLCVDRPNAIVMSTFPGVELAVNGRLYTHVLELAMEVERGRFPSALWRGDVEAPNVRCVVTAVHTAPLDRIEEPLLPPDVTRAMRDRFRFVEVARFYAIYRSP